MPVAGVPAVTCLPAVADDPVVFSIMLLLAILFLPGSCCCWHPSYVVGCCSAASCCCWHPEVLRSLGPVFVDICSDPGLATFLASSMLCKRESKTITKMFM